MNKFYKFIYGTFRGVFRLIFRMEIKGTENEPAQGPFLICTNHQSNNDTICVAASTKNQLRFFAKKSLFKTPIVKHFVKAMGAYPVDKSSARSSVSGIKESIKILNSGEIVAMFPQGHRYIGQDPRTTPLMSGAGMIAFRAKCDVLPCCICTEDYRTRFFKKTQIIYGEVIKYEELGFTEGGKDEYERATKIIFDRICKLLDRQEEENRLKKAKK
jgi:1-acyl-sn-glycerol-3-phosphate acyltransferase